MRWVLALLAMAMAWSFSLADETIPDSLIAGTWATDEDGEVTIAPCLEGKTGECGFLSKIVIPEDIYAVSKAAIDAIGIANLTDDRNPDPALRTRTLLGMPMITLDRKVSPLRYEGELYNPEDGSKYVGIVELVDAMTLKLTGCLAWLTLACESRIWTRVPEEDVAKAMENRDTLPDNVALWDGPPELPAAETMAAAPAN